jgi:hypothetical protein
MSLPQGSTVYQKIRDLKQRRRKNLRILFESYTCTWNLQRPADYAVALYFDFTSGRFKCAWKEIQNAKSK